MGELLPLILTEYDHVEDLMKEQLQKLN